MHDEISGGRVVSDSDIVDTILASIKENMSLKHLQDSEDDKFAEMLETENLDEGIRDLVKISSIAALLAVPSLLPAKAVERELT